MSNDRSKYSLFKNAIEKTRIEKGRDSSLLYIIESMDVFDDILGVAYMYVRLLNEEYATIYIKSSSVLSEKRKDYFLEFVRMVDNEQERIYENTKIKGSFTVETAYRTIQQRYDICMLYAKLNYSVTQIKDEYNFNHKLLYRELERFGFNKRKNDECLA